MHGDSLTLSPFLSGARVPARNNPAASNLCLLHALSRSTLTARPKLFKLLEDISAPRSKDGPVRMTSWIYVFSRFTPEALLFEALGIFLLCAAYAAFWVLKKRKHGVLGMHAPATAVKGYLSDLIVDAEQLRAQLWGLLGAEGSGAAFTIDPSKFTAVTAAPSTNASAAAGGDPAAATQMVALESKMLEQAKAMETIMGDKTRLEKELAEARAGAKPGAGGGGPSADLSKLQEKIALLEAKLAEYSVIEDDLANLKRLQQENAQLKAQLGGAPAPAPAATPAQAVQANPPAPEATAAADAAFEGLVDQVEQSLAAPEATPAPAEAPPAPAEAAAAQAPTEATSPPAGGDKSDADLVAEFEKMLNL